MEGSMRGRAARVVGALSFKGRCPASSGCAALISGRSSEKQAGVPGLCLMVVLGPPYRAVGFALVPELGSGQVFG